MRDTSARMLGPASSKPPGQCLAKPGSFFIFAPWSAPNHVLKSRLPQVVKRCQRDLAQCGPLRSISAITAPEICRVLDLAPPPTLTLRISIHRPCASRSTAQIGASAGRAGKNFGRSRSRENMDFKFRHSSSLTDLMIHPSMFVTMEEPLRPVLSVSSAAAAAAASASSLIASAPQTGLPGAAYSTMPPQHARRSRPTSFEPTFMVSAQSSACLSPL
mmetsp:Transcript_67884/g.208009  ORF Transcript_67884/g.208009 Transcript_67884/m.208009 type:complete len:217 (+) Transcript_67884:358-1008(+)